VQRLWLAGDRDAARKRVPTAIGLGTNLVGTPDLVRERLRLYRDAGITTLRAGLADGPEGGGIEASLRQLGTLLDLVREVNEEVGRPGA
jgi:alkanesulfonate monooxygenase SsuD/methylene tetrahydromethanopterin reductase-like flavin-dependent oxidoreductase (luciferase family)